MVKYSKSTSGGVPWLMIGIAVFVLIFLWKGVKALGSSLGLIKPKTDNANPEQRSAEIKDIKVPGVLPKNPQAYKSIADTLERAMNLIGTDETTVFNSLKGLTTAELVQVYKDFGIRRNYIFAVEMFTGDLFMWFTNEFDGWGDDKYLQRLRLIFAPTGLWNS